MYTTSTMQYNRFTRFDEMPHRTLGGLGPRRLSILRLRDRCVPWQLRHFYYHHEAEAQLGARFSIGILLSQLVLLFLRTGADIIDSSLLLPLHIAQAAAIILPGLKFPARRVNLTRGKLLYRADEPANEVMLLAEGYGRLYLEHEDGRCLTVGLVAPGDLFGEEALLALPERVSAFEAVLPSEIDVISREEFTKIVSNDPSLLWNVTEHLAQRLLIQQRHMMRLAFEPVERRLAWILLELAVATNIRALDSDDPTVFIYHKDLAAILGVWRETITVILNRWHTDGLIRQFHGEIIVKDMDRFRKLAEDTSPGT